MAPFTDAQIELRLTTTLGLGAGTIPGHFGECAPGECPPYFLQGIRRSCGRTRFPSRRCSFTR